MGFEMMKESYAGGIKEISIGKGEKAVTVGGSTCYPFYQFEGDMPNKPRIAMEVWDIKPEEWPEAALAPFKDVVSDPAAWAKKCVDVFAADMIVLQLKSIDPNGDDASADSAVATVKKVLAAVDVPLIVWGIANPQKDEEVLKKISEDCAGENLTLGPIEDKNHKGIGASAMGYGHSVISSSPIDVNLAKQINILLENLGVPMDKVIADPTTGGLGYGLEYSYSVMERLKMAALAQGDDKLQIPVINNLGNEVWKCKEAKQTIEDAPELGDPERRGILMEAVGAVTYLMAGSDILIMRHPEAIKLTKAYIDLLSDGGSALDVAPLSKLCDDVDIDFKAISPDPDLTIKEEKAKKQAPKAAAPKAAAPKAAAPKAAAPKAAAPKAAAVEEEPKVDTEAEVKAAAAAKAEADVKAAEKVKADAKAKADAEKAKAEAEIKAKKDAEVKAAAEEVAQREADEAAIREKRAKEQEERAAKAGKEEDKKVTMTAAKNKRSKLSKFKKIKR